MWEQRNCVRFWGIVMALAVGVGSAFAQSTNSGEIRGTVTDPTGAVVPGVRVSVLNTETGVKTDVTTNTDGLYDAVSILPGSYQITFTAQGFDTLVRQGITVQVGLLTVNAELKVGTAQQQVEVTAEATLLKTETAEQSTTIDEKTLMALPDVGQSWGNFTKMIPGASGSGTGIAVNGNLPYFSNFMADGASTTLPHSANTDTSILETMSEMQIQTSTYSAEYGIGGDTFNQISKGGTNDWHGAAYEYFENNFLNARNFFAPTVSYQRFDNFGGAVGGPILKNKFFFYFDTDKTINNSAYYSLSTFPTAGEFGTVNQRAGDFNNPFFPTIYNPVTRQPFPNNTINLPLDPVALNIQKDYPIPNLPGYVNNYGVEIVDQSPALKFFGRLDYNISDKNRLTFSITQRNNPAFYPAADEWDTGYGDVDSYNAQISDVWTISPNVINEFRFGFTRQGNWFAPKDLNKNIPQSVGLDYSKANVPPEIEPNGIYSWIGPATNAIYVENSFDPSDVVTMIKGRHILKFGGEVLAYQDNSTPWGNLNGATFYFSGVFTQSAPFSGVGGSSYADFLLGYVDSWSASVTPNVGLRQKSPQMFVQDDFKVRPNLTLNLGIRYQIQGGWSEVANRIGGFDPTITNPVTNTPGAIWFAPTGRSTIQKPIYDIFLPRVGFSWAAKNNLVVRGGFGIYSYNWSIDRYAGGYEGFGTNSTGSETETNQKNPVFILSNPNPPLNYVMASHDPGAYNGQTVNYYPYHTPVAKNYQWSFSVQQQLPMSMVAEVAYVGSHTNNLSFPIDFNQVPASDLAQSVATGNGQALRPYPQYQTIQGDTYNGWSNFDSLQLSLTKRFAHGLQFEVNYTWEKMLDTQDTSGWGSRDGGQTYQNAYDPAANYALSNFDVPQMFKGDLIYQLPFGKGRKFLASNAVVDGILGGWQISTLFVLDSGHPFTPVLTGIPDDSGSLAGYNYQWRPNLIGNPRLSNPTIGEWFNPCTLLLNGTTNPTGCTNPVFAEPAPGTFGNEGRNILFGPGIIGVDLSLGKSFRFPLPHETGELQIRIDAQNVLNHPNFDLPNNSIGGGSGGIISGTTGDYNSTNNSYGSRVIQLGARISF